MLNKEQKEALCFYEGDVSSFEDDYLLDPKAYVTWNALLFPGIQTELARSREGRRLNPTLLSDPERLIALSQNLLSVMKPYGKQRRVYRVERLADYEIFCKTGYFTSFISTSTARFLSSYQDKIDLVLLEIMIEPDTPCADFSALLDVYEKQEEAEILLPPFLQFTETALPMNESISAITDRYHQPPRVYAMLHPQSFVLDETPVDQPFSDENIKASVRCYEQWNNGGTPEEADIEKYLQYKQGIQNALKKWIGLNQEVITDRS